MPPSACPLTSSMKVMKERIARRANREDGCTGSFWQGRFTSVALLDQAAVIACMVYVDLNPIRAKQAVTPETSTLTSVHDRIAARQAHRLEASLPSTAIAPMLIGPEAGLWIAPLLRCTPTSDSAREHWPFPFDIDTYLKLVDYTGRIVRSGKRGAIPANLEPILARLNIETDAWITAMTSGGCFLGSAIGSAVSRAAEALRRGVKWVVDRMKLHRAPQTAA